MEEERLLEERKQIVFVKAGALFEALWNEIVRCVAEAARKKVPVATSIMAGNRLVYVSPSKMTGPVRKEIALSLAKDRTCIAIAGSPVRKLEIDKSESNSVYLKRDGKQISIPDAAIQLLDPLLFGNLPARLEGFSPPDPDFIR